MQRKIGYRILWGNGFFVSLKQKVPPSLKFLTAKNRSKLLWENEFFTLKENSNENQGSLAIEQNKRQRSASKFFAGLIEYFQAYPEVVANFLQENHFSSWKKLKSKERRQIIQRLVEQNIPAAEKWLLKKANTNQGSYCSIINPKETESYCLLVEKNGNGLKASYFQTPDQIKERALPQKMLDQWTEESAQEPVQIGRPGIYRSGSSSTQRSVNRLPAQYFKPFLSLNGNFSKKRGRERQ